MAIASTSIRVAKEKSFADIPLDFTIHPNTKDLPAKKGVDAIKQAVKTIILTNHGEKPFQPFYGGNIISKMFENADEFTSFELEEEIKITLRKHEPRVICNNVQIGFTPSNHMLNCTINFLIVGFSEAESVTISFNRIR